MRDDEFDLIVVGAGSGGIAASRRAASHGVRVAVCEADSVGGTCVMRGCVPKKLLMYGSQYHGEIADARGFGYDIAEPAFAWARLMTVKDAEIDRLSKIYTDLLSEAGVRVISGRAHLLDAHTVEVAAKRYSAKHILIATGSRPAPPDIPGAEHGISSNEALQLPVLPRRLTIVGGGYVGVELASIFHALGSHVTMCIRDDRLLLGFDGDVSTALRTEMEKRGVRFMFEAKVTAVSRRGPVMHLALASGQVLESDVVLFATGRVPNTQDLGLARAGVELGARGAVKVDAYSRSSVPSVYAVGDCSDRMNLTPVAIAEGHAFADTLFGAAAPTAIDYDVIPSAVFGQPPMACVGLSEEKARARGHAVSAFVKSFRPLKHALTGRDVRTMMKLVVERETDRVLGVHMVGPDAPEIIQGFAVALRCGLTKAQLDATVGIHPTAAEEFVTMRRERCGPFDD
jgi:glutathione reductase (NADPH)